MNNEFDKTIDEEMLTAFQIRLRQLMATKGFNQIRLADETGISKILINKYINGKTVPSILNLMKIARALGCTLDELLHVW